MSTLSISGTTTTRTGTLDGGSLRLTIHVGGESVSGRGTLLTETVFSVIEFLAVVEKMDPTSSAVIEISVPTVDDVRLTAEIEAFVHATKGLLQSWVLERGAASCPANLIVTEPGLAAEAEKVAEYFASEFGGFSRGSTFDLRETEA